MTERYQWTGRFDDTLIHAMGCVNSAEWMGHAPETISLTFNADRNVDSSLTITAIVQLVKSPSKPAGYEDMVLIDRYKRIDFGTVVPSDARRVS